MVKNTMENKDATPVHGGKGLAAISMGLNVFITSALFLLYLFTGSSALLAQAVHSMTDVIGSLFVIIGIHISERKSESFPWGLYKIENLAALFVSGMIFLSAYGIARMIYEPSPVDLRNLDITLVVLFIMALPILLFSRYEIKRARELNSPSLMADAESWRMDLAPLAVVAIGVAGARLNYPVLDRIAAFVVIIMVIKAGYGILKDSIKSLLDASVGRETLNDINAVIKGFPEVKEIISLNARNSGRFVFVYIDLSLSFRRLKATHEVATNIEREIKNRIPFVERVIIYYEPERKDYLRYAVPLGDSDGDISEHFGRAPFIAIWDKRLSDASVLSQEIIENPFLDIEKGKGIRLAEFLIDKGIDVLYLTKDFEGKGPEYVFSDAEVEIRSTDIEKLEDLINRK